MVCAIQNPRTWVLALAAVVAMVLVPYSASAQTYDVTVAVTFYSVDQNGVVTVGSSYSDQYHPLVVMLPAEVFFSNEVTFEDKRSGTEYRKVKISIGIDEKTKKWKEKKYSGPYDWDGEPKGEKKYTKEYGNGEDSPWISTIFELYYKENGEWVLDDWQQVGQNAQVFTLDGPYAPGDPASILLDDEMIRISTDQALDPAA